jgi:hypothetical protein
MAYITKTTIKYKGKIYKEGTKIDISKDDIKDLIRYVDEIEEQEKDKGGKKK